MNVARKTIESSGLLRHLKLFYKVKRMVKPPLHSSLIRFVFTFKIVDAIIDEVI